MTTNDARRIRRFRMPSTFTVVTIGDLVVFGLIAFFVILGVARL